MSATVVRAALVAMYALFPLYGTFAAFAPHPPTAPLVPVWVAAAIGLVVVAAVAGVIAGAWQGRRTPPVLGGLLLANIGATYAGAALGFDPLVGLAFATIIAGMVFAHHALWAAYAQPGTGRAVIGAVLVSGLLGALLAIALVVLRRPADLFAYNHGRAVGTFLNPNELAEYLLAYLGIAGGVATVRRGTAEGHFGAACAAVGAVALTLTFSRWGLFSAAVGLAVFAAAERRRWRPAALALVLAVAVNVGFAATHHQAQDTGARDVAWRAGISTWLTFPLTGVGPLAFERLYPVLRAPDAPGARTPVAYDPHDLWLSIASETGTVGVACFAALVIAFVRLVPRVASEAPRERRTLAYAFFAGVVAVEVHGLLNSASIAFGVFTQFSALTLAAARWGIDAGG